MSKLIVNDRDYKDWINSLCERFDQSRVRASVKANDEMLRFYWSIGEDIVKKNAEAKWGDSVIAMMSQDLSERLPGTGGFSATNLGYMKRFYLLYSQLDKFCPQLVGDSKFEKVKQIIFYIPWGHHHYLIDKFMDNPKRAFYYAQLTLANNWSLAHATRAKCVAYAGIYCHFRKNEYLCSSDFAALSLCGGKSVTNRWI